MNLLKNKQSDILINISSLTQVLTVYSKGILSGVPSGLLTSQSGVWGGCAFAVVI